MNVNVLQALARHLGLDVRGVACLPVRLGLQQRLLQLRVEVDVNDCATTRATAASSDTWRHHRLGAGLLRPTGVEGGGARRDRARDALPLSVLVDLRHGVKPERLEGPLKICAGQGLLLGRVGAAVRGPPDARGVGPMARGNVLVHEVAGRGLAEDVRVAVAGCGAVGMVPGPMPAAQAASGCQWQCRSQHEQALHGAERRRHKGARSFNQCGPLSRRLA
mmetsp:Transcript_64020/g.164756  ORF Transcript_64020/g.164756 Transcript_64020/m.164756 type:complete len:220 (-) Transcript_64020:8-667(-)